MRKRSTFLQVTIALLCLKSFRRTCHKKRFLVSCRQLISGTSTTTISHRTILTPSKDTTYRIFIDNAGGMG